MLILLGIILLLILSRLIIGIIVNAQYMEYGDIIMLNVMRFKIFADIAKMVEFMVVYSKSDINYDETFRNSFYDYSVLLNSKYASSVNNYKSFLIGQSKEGIDILDSNHLLLTKKVSGLSSKYVKLLEPSAVLNHYYSVYSNEIEYINSIKYVSLSLMSHSIKIISMVENGNDIVEDDFHVYYVLNTTFGSIISYTEFYYEGILLNWKDIDSMQDNLSLILMISVSGFIFALIIIIFIFSTIINKEISLMLAMFTKIRKVQLVNQLLNQTTFLRVINTEEVNTSKNNIIEAEEYDIEEDQDTNLNNKQDENQPKSYIPHENNKWIVTLIAIILGGIIIGTYFGCDYLGKNLSDSIHKKTLELYYLQTNIVMNSYTLTFLYRYILSEKKAICGDNDCGLKLETVYEIQSEFINTLLTSHKKQKGIMTDSYLNMFSNIIEGNPCETIEYFQRVKNCTNFMGGIFQHGVYASSSIFKELGMAIYRDFSSEADPKNEITIYLNDERILNLEILMELLLNPAYHILSQKLVSDAKNIISGNTNLQIVLLIIFTVFFISLGILGKFIMVEHLRRLMFDIKMLLSNLPPKMILNTEDILRYLLEGPIAKK